MLILLLGSLAFGGATVDELTAKMLEIEPLRVYRMVKGAPAIPVSELSKIAKGTIRTGMESVDGYAAKKAWGAAVLDVSIERMWAAVNDDQSRVAYTKLSYAELLEGESCGNGRKVLQYLPVPMVTDRWWIANMRQNIALQRASTGTVRELAWRGTFDLHDIKSAEGRAVVEKGMPVEFTEGSWLLIDLGAGRTLLEYYTWSDPGGSVPAGLASTLAANGISELIESIARLAHDGPRCPIE